MKMDVIAYRCAVRHFPIPAEHIGGNPFFKVIDDDRDEVLFYLLGLATAASGISPDRVEIARNNCFEREGCAVVPQNGFEHQL